jgi:hypothetical protein
MARIHLFQIYYSDDTRRSLDVDFVPLDNARNERPDWREYWPIRRFLQATALVADDYYGFFSPSLHAKTRLTAQTIREFVRTHEGADALLFSPYYDQIALFLNPWEHGVAAHQAHRSVFADSLALIAPQFEIEGTVSSSLDSVFCNYIVARPRFWREWLACGERIFSVAEAAATPLGRALSTNLHYRVAAPAKVFIIERMASALFATQSGWKLRAHNPMLLPLANPAFQTLGAELASLDALKIAHQLAPQPQFRKAFFSLRDRCSAIAANRLAG